MTEVATTEEKATAPETPVGISRIEVEGFKSIRDRTAIEIRPLTILAGANSSGKSSIMQPLLLLKQTLEAPYDPGPLLLNGPNVKFSSVDQCLFGVARKTVVRRVPWFSVLIGTSDGRATGSRIGRRADDGPVDVLASLVAEDGASVWLDRVDLLEGAGEGLEVICTRGFLFVVPVPGDAGLSQTRMLLSLLVPTGIRKDIASVIHLPGLRGNPERNYGLSAVGDTFPGVFSDYVASVLAGWQASNSDEHLWALSDVMQRLGLTWAVRSRRIDDTRTELRVGRTPRKGFANRDLVNIADVGLGVSQVLPVVVALHAAQPGQLVYIEQPELHLHPKAQVALASVLARAAMRGVRVVAETHSSLLILGVQTLIAEGELSPDLVALHWFERGEDGATRVTTAELDEAGSFGDWPADFDDVSLNATNRYIDAAEARLRGDR